MSTCPIETAVLGTRIHGSRRSICQYHEVTIADVVRVSRNGANATQDDQSILRGLCLEHDTVLFWEREQVSDGRTGGVPESKKGSAVHRHGLSDGFSDFRSKHLLVAQPESLPQRKGEESGQQSVGKLFMPGSIWRRRPADTIGGLDGSTRDPWNDYQLQQSPPFICACLQLGRPDQLGVASGVEAPPCQANSGTIPSFPNTPQGCFSGHVVARHARPHKGGNRAPSE